MKLYNQSTYNLRIRNKLNMLPANQPRDAYWHNYYEDSLKRRLQKAISLIRASRRRPLELNDHLGTLLVYLNRTHARPEYHADAVELLLLLHPIPLHFGYWEEWEAEIRFAIGVCISKQWQQRHAELLNHLIFILYYTGRLQEILQIGPQALGIARAANVPHLLTVIASMLTSTLLHLNRADDALDLMSQVENEVTTQDMDALTRTSATISICLIRADLLRRTGEALEKSLLECHKAVALAEKYPALNPGETAYVYHSRGLIRCTADRFTSRSNASCTPVSLLANSSLSSTAVTVCRRRVFMARFLAITSNHV